MDLVKKLQNSFDPDFMDPMQPLGESVYRNWKSDRPLPWTIGYASSYAGNLWRKGVMERLYGDYLPKMKEAGILNDIVVTQSNLKDAVQIQQMRQLVDQASRMVEAVSQRGATSSAKSTKVFSCRWYLTY